MTTSLRAHRPEIDQQVPLEEMQACGHSHATHTYSLTKDPKLVQNTLGHNDVSTTLGLYVDENEGDSSACHLSHLL